MKPILEVKGLYKEYRRGAQKEKYLSLRDNLFNTFKPSKKKESFWALEDINFDVYPGDSLSIIGKNGAGKSTLLKILSRITPPTKGEIILRGRLASLLEVGTGFHPELTGRENIYLNGSILGLGRSEINRQFDAIVDFSGVEAFLDTPLKHYSSGMQLRLAFAVAAHLEPEMLLIDEVLAVGDSAFQQKCIAKMTEVSQSGRTILFVSHNMQAIRNLCQKGVLLANGKQLFVGSADETIQEYLQDKKVVAESNVINCKHFERKSGKRELEFSELSTNSWSVMPGEEFFLSMKLTRKRDIVFSDLLFGVNILDVNEQCVIHMSNVFKNQLVLEHKEATQYEWRLPKMNLKPGIYTVGIFLRASEEIQDWIRDAAVLEVLPGNIYGFSNSEMIQGVVQPEFEFGVNEIR